MSEKRFEILKCIPPDGPMYIPISADEEPFYSEGYVVKFRTKNRQEWVANFKPGWTDYYHVFDFAKHDTIVVFAGGQGYIMTPDNEKPKLKFGLTIEQVIQNYDGSLICSDGIHILIFNNKTGEFWESDRISWDGIKDLKIVNNTLHGQSYDPTNSIKPWSEFTIDIETKKINGGSYQNFLKMNSHLEVDNDGLLKEANSG